MVRIHLGAAATALFVLSLLGAAACSSANEYAGSGGGASCDTCYNVYVNGGIACGPGPSADAWNGLALCACGEVPTAGDGGLVPSPCASACTASYCLSKPADMACGTCLVAKCAAQESACAAN